MKKRINQLDSFRYIASLMIVFSHFTFFNRNPLAEKIYSVLWNPFLAVDYFFILSGFGIYLSYNDKNENYPTKYTFVNSVLFAINRIKRQYVVYLLAMLAMVPIGLYDDLNEGTIVMALAKTVVKMIACATMLQSLFGTSYISHSLNAPCWFFSTLFICYIFSFIVLNKKNNRISKHIGVVANTLVVVVLSALFMILEGELRKRGLSFINELSTCSPFVRFFFFTQGMLIARWYVAKGINVKNHINLGMEYGICVLVILWYFGRHMAVNNNISFVVLKLIDISTASMLMFALIMGKSKIAELLKANNLSSLGKSSWIVYLIHFPIIQYMELLFYKYGNANSIFMVCLETLLIIITICLLKRLVLCLKKVVEMKNVRGIT